MKIKSYKEAFNNIEPDIHMEMRLLTKIKRPKHEVKFLKTAVSMTLVLALTLGGFYGIPQIKSGEHKTNNAVNSSGIFQDIKNKFTLSAYASEGNSSNNKVIENQTKTEINDAKITLPFGRIKRGKYVEYIYTEGERKGQVYKGYEGEYTDNVCFDFQGKNIKSIDLESTSGKFNFQNWAKREEMEKNRELYTAKIILDKGLFDEKKDLLSQFKKLWTEGSLDKYKTQYFEGRSIDLDDYQISVENTKSYDNNGKEIPSSEYVFDKKVEIPVNSVVFTIAIKDTDNKWWQLNKSEILIPYDKCNNNFHIEWVPEEALKRVSEYTPVEYEELPGDIITINVTYENGEVQTKKVSLSFNSEGKMVAQMK